MFCGGTPPWITWMGANIKPPPGARSSILRRVSSRTSWGVPKGRTLCVSQLPPQMVRSLCQPKSSFGTQFDEWRRRESNPRPSRLLSVRRGFQVALPDGFEPPTTGVRIGRRLTRATVRRGLFPNRSPGHHRGHHSRNQLQSWRHFGDGDHDSIE